MSSQAAAFFERWHADHQQMKEQMPDLAREFGTFYRAMMKEGALSVREKELIALGIGLAMRCTACIHLHAQGCLKAGASREQVLEAAQVAVMMQGGPTFTYVPEVLHALDHLLKQSGS